MLPAEQRPHMRQWLRHRQTSAILKSLPEHRPSAGRCPAIQPMARTAESPVHGSVWLSSQPALAAAASVWQAGALPLHVLEQSVQHQVLCTAPGEPPSWRVASHFSTVYAQRRFGEAKARSGTPNTVSVRPTTSALEERVRRCRKAHGAWRPVLSSLRVGTHVVSASVAILSRASVMIGQPTGSLP